MKNSSKNLKVNTGLRMQSLRKKLHLNQEELAQHLNVSNGTISAIENGSIVPNFKIIYHLAIKFNVNLSFLLFGSGEMFNPDPVKQSLPRDFPPDQALFLENFIRDFSRSELFRHSIMAYCKKFRLKYAKLMQQESKLEENQQETRDKIKND